MRIPVDVKDAIDLDDAEDCSPVSGAKIAAMLSDFLNTADGSYKRRSEFVATVLKQHRALQHEFFTLFIQTMQAWAAEQEFDSRNSRVVLDSRRILELLSIGKHR